MMYAHLPLLLASSLAAETVKGKQGGGRGGEDGGSERERGGRGREGRRLEG